MNSPFILENNSKNIYTVSWPKFGDVRHVDQKIKLMELIFVELGIDNEVGFVIKFSVDELNVMWVKPQSYFFKSELDNYVQDFYEIVGVSFRSLNEAEKFKTFLDKKLVWKILND